MTILLEAIVAMAMVANGQGSDTPTFRFVSCQVGEGDNCALAENVGGGGGQGGNAGNTINVIIQGSQGGSGGNGGNASGGNPPAAPIGAEPPQPAGKEPVQSTSEQKIQSTKSLISKCFVEVDGKKVIEAHGCDFERTPGENVKSSLRDPKDKRKYVVSWTTYPNGTSQGFLQGGTSPEVRPLGTLLRDKDKACWVKSDAGVRICAWK